MSLRIVSTAVVSGIACVLVAGCSSGSPTSTSSTPADASTISPSSSNSPSSGSQSGPKVPYNKWGWFKDTYWIVPENGVYSVTHKTDDPGSFQVVRGQTVFHITDYFNGYWTGIVVVKITEAQVPNCQYVLGQTTPEGRVYMTMYDSETGEVVNDPVGQMVKKAGQWTMVNTMTAPTKKGTISHWAYMVQSKASDRTYDNLPFANVSISEFMSSCPAGPPIKGIP